MMAAMRPSAAVGSVAGAVEHRHGNAGRLSAFDAVGIGREDSTCTISTGRSSAISVDDGLQVRPATGEQHADLQLLHLISFSRSQGLREQAALVGVLDLAPASDDAADAEGLLAGIGRGGLHGLSLVRFTMSTIPRPMLKVLSASSERFA